MTAQFPHTIAHGTGLWDIVGLSAGDLFHPSELGLEPVYGRNTACWDGYLPSYEVRNGILELQDLRIYVQGEPPVVAGVTPRRLPPTGMFDAHYEGLHYRINYTGGILGGAGFIQELYVHMGYHPAWKYSRVVELLFNAGELTQAHDRSRAIAEHRAHVLSTTSRDALHGMAPDTRLDAWIEQAFSLTYEWPEEE